MNEKNKELEDFLEFDELDYLKEIEESEANKKYSEADNFYIMFTLALNKMTGLADKLSLIMTESLNPANQGKISVKDIQKNITYYDLIRKKINETVVDMVEISNSKNYFWRDCSCEVYKSYFEGLKKWYQHKFKGATELDFIKYELQFLVEEVHNSINIVYKEILPVDYLATLNFRRHLTTQNVEFFALAKSKKLEFVKNELLNRGYIAEIETNNGSVKVNFKEANHLMDENDSESLKLKGIPNFNVKQRYELFKRLGYDKTIHTLNTDKQMTKNKILAIILGISPDNAKQLINGTYEGLSLKDEEFLMDFLNNQNIKI